MSFKVLVNLDLGGNEILNVLLQKLASDPSSPVAGRIYYNTTFDTVRYYNGTVWVELTAGTGGDADTLDGEDGTYYLNRTNHTGTQTASTISDLATVVKAYTLDEFANPVADLDMDTFKITDMGDPTNPQDAATKAYVDLLAQGVKDVKQSVRAATTANITLSAPQTIDGVSVIAGDRVLVKNQSTAADNGIYVVAAGAWSRSADADSSAEVTGGMFTFVTEGTVNADSGWTLTTNDPITLGSTSLTFAQFTGAGQITAGTGLVKSGNTLSLDSANGYAARIYTTTIGDNSNTELTITHNFGTRAVEVQVFTTASPYDTVYTDVERTTTNTVLLRFAVAPTTGQYTVVVTG